MKAPPAQASQNTGTDDATGDQCIELAEALCWESMRQAIAGTRNAASLLEDASFRIGMETACDEIETRLNLGSPAQADTQQSKKGEGK